MFFPKLDEEGNEVNKAAPESLEDLQGLLT